MNRLQPGCAAVVCREWHTLAVVRFEQRPCHLARGRVKENGWSGAVIPLRRPFVFGILRSAFSFADRNVAVPLPVPHGRIVGHDLALFVTRMTWLTLGWHEHLNPILYISHRLAQLPICFSSLIHDLERLAEPIDGCADQLIGADTELHSALSIRQFLQIRHRVGVARAGLERVIEPPVPPHARYVMVRDMAVIEEFPRYVLSSPAPPFP